MNQKRKNGFTLIELLAVIVILAIIALIALPVILNIIDKANIVAFKDTAYSIISAGELYFAERQLDLEGMQEENVTFTLPDSTNTLEIKGNVPVGSMTITRNGKISLMLKNDRYCATKGLDDKDITITEDVDNCELPGGDDVGISLPAVGTSAEDCTWEQIKAIGDAGKADEYFNLGDTKTFTTTDGKTVVMEIVAFGADEKADGSGKAAISWVSKDCVANRTMNSTDTNAGGWKESEMRNWMQGEFYMTLPAGLKSSIVVVAKTYYDYDTKSTLSCDDNVWIPSYREIYGGNSYENIGTDYTGFFKDNKLRIKYNTTGAMAIWSLRSAGEAMSRNFRGVSSDGSSSYYYAYKSYGVVLGFCS